MEDAKKIYLICVMLIIISFLSGSIYQSQIYSIENSNHNTKILNNQIDNNIILSLNSNPLHAEIMPRDIMNF